MARADTLTFIDPQLDPDRSFVEVPATKPRPLDRAPVALDVQIPGRGRLRDLSTWLDETYTTSLLVLDGTLGSGQVVYEWYGEEAGPGTLLLGASMTKSVLAHLVGQAVGSGALQLDDEVGIHVPELADSGYGRCTVRQVASMTTGTAWVEDHRDPDGPATRLLRSFSEGEDSRVLLAGIGPADPPGTRWEYNTADSQVLDWVRERATDVPFAAGVEALWRDLGCVRGAAVAVDGRGAALAGGGLAACAEDWLRLAALQLDGTAFGTRLLDPEWVRRSSSPAYPWLAPGLLPSSITTHAGFGYHWWPCDPDGVRVTADGMRGQFGYVDHGAGRVAVKTSLWPHADVLVDRQLRDLSYLGLPRVIDASRTAPTTPRR